MYRYLDRAALLREKGLEEIYVREPYGYMFDKEQMELKSFDSK